MKLTQFLVLSSIMIVAGCSQGPSRIAPPSIPSDAGDAAVKQYDTDGDNALAAAELDKAPALKSTLARLDENGDKKLTAEEIGHRIQSWRDSKVALITVIVTVTYDQRPLSGAEVALVPDKFLGTAIRTARGTTNQNGATAARISDVVEEQGVSPGFYRIEISKKNGAQETLPAKYNTASELGIEIAPDVPASRDFVLNLTSR